MKLQKEQRLLPELKRAGCWMVNEWMLGVQGRQQDGDLEKRESRSIEAGPDRDRQTFDRMREALFEMRRYLPRISSGKGALLPAVDRLGLARRQLRAKLAKSRKSRLAVANWANAREHLAACLQAQQEKDRTMSANKNHPG